MATTVNEEAGLGAAETQREPAGRPAASFGGAVELAWLAPPLEPAVQVRGGAAALAREVDRCRVPRAGDEICRLQAWHAQALASLDAGLCGRKDTRRQIELDAAMKRIGELNKEHEFLRTRCEAKFHSVWWGSKR